MHAAENANSAPLLRDHPTWDDTIRDLFAAPYWIDATRCGGVASQWQGCMSGYLIDLSSYASVAQWSMTIYDHLHSRAMPLTTDPSQFWPEEALEQLRVWVNEGCREHASDPVAAREQIPRPAKPVGFRVRKNIDDLTPAELDIYRMRIEDLGARIDGPDASWQKIGNIHTNWCLHYQEAFVLWHRANMLYFEAMLGCPVPYWNWMSPRAATDGDPAAGLPRAFKDETYVHPQTGEVRPNPLRYAVARGGRSKACIDDPTPGPGCEFVHRDPVLYTEGDDQRQARQDKLDLLLTYQDQVRQAFAWPTFSVAEGTPGYPWANIQTFPAPDSDYPNKCDFDGRYEQPHDNLHGWVGPDMADNTYTAFDPVFWSHHAMIDLVFEAWLRAHPTAMFTASFVLQPFVGPLASTVDEASPRRFIYTTIGDMAKDSRALGFDFAGLETIDFTQPHPRTAALALAGSPRVRLYLRFDGVRCTHDSYAIDVFLNRPAAVPADASTRTPEFVTRISRNGMGIADEKGRCIRGGVTRIVDATATARALGLGPADLVTVTTIVTDLRTRRQLSLAEIAALPGFVAVAVWGPDTESPSVAPASAPASACCREDAAVEHSS